MDGTDVVFVGYCASSLGVLECGSTAKAASLSFHPAPTRFSGECILVRTGGRICLGILSVGARLHVRGSSCWMPTDGPEGCENEAFERVEDWDRH